MLTCSRGAIQDIAAPSVGVIPWFYQHMEVDFVSHLDAADAAVRVPRKTYCRNKHQEVSIAKDGPQFAYFQSECTNIQIPMV